MKIGIIGLPQTGKKTLFALLTGESHREKRLGPQKPLNGFAEVHDPRFDQLVQIYSPQKVVRSRLEMTLLPRIEEQSVSQGRIFREMGEVEALCHIVRIFKNDSVYHVWQSIDARRDIDYVNNELILHDLLLVEKRLERIEKDSKKVKDEAALKEKELLLKMKSQLEEELPLRFLDLATAERQIIASYPLLTRKEMVVVLNVSDTDLGQPQKTRAIAEHYRLLRMQFLTIAVQAEFEIADLESREEREQFMSAMDIEEPALAALAKACIKALGLISFFTVRSNEVRQWFVKNGSSAVEAAGAIHTDMARGFIRAEVIKFSNLAELGSEDKVKAKGKLSIKGRDYIVEDGDILGIRFSV